MKRVQEAREPVWFEELADDYVYGELENDAIGYFTGNYGYSMDNIMESNLFSIDIDAAAKEAVSIDGIAHFLDRYDGEEEEVEVGRDTFLFYGI